jgi:hypothetical protein
VGIFHHAMVVVNLLFFLSYLKCSQKIEVVFISSLSGMIQLFTHIFSGSKATTQLLPPGDPA